MPLMTLPRPRQWALALATTLPLLAWAHDTWLLPSTTLVTGRSQSVVLDAAVSTDLFIAERPLAWGELRVTGPAGQPLPAGERSHTATLNSVTVELPTEGTYRISHLSDSLMASYQDAEGQTQRFRGSPAEFAQQVPASAKVLGVLHMVNRQQTFVSREKATVPAFAPEGQGLEVLPLDAVNDLSDGDHTRFTLLLNGKPLAGETLSLVREGNRYRYDRAEQTLTTDAQGQFTVTWAAPGRYWLGASHGERPGGPSLTGGTRDQPIERAGLSVTFEVLPR
ncbi:DUF4198 domain-containing protein [Ideonella sp. B7]|uniref:DUF4198 domain-containing protein n=1 Tax=Ideonella benzenivorans TaxID=2831643 RepID=UPI001CEC6417|nr:DUF4198 domain-containing protein [Ideonella benzenivorans]MCA6216552.1 DUF4198 domain-containing protein [Ideonella benzenivorans]